jgi:hypothetical protein
MDKSYGLLSTLTANVAFMRQKGDGYYEPVKYSPRSVPSGRSQFKIEKFCMDPKGMQKTGAFTELAELVRPRCARGWNEVETSATAPVAAEPDPDPSTVTPCQH